MRPKHEDAPGLDLDLDLDLKLFRVCWGWGQWQMPWICSVSAAHPQHLLDGQSLDVRLTEPCCANASTRLTWGAFGPCARYSQSSQRGFGQMVVAACPQPAKYLKTPYPDTLLSLYLNPLCAERNMPCCPGRPDTSDPGEIARKRAQQSSSYCIGQGEPPEAVLALVITRRPGTPGGMGDDRKSS